MNTFSCQFCVTFERKPARGDGKKMSEREWEEEGRFLHISKGLGGGHVATVTPSPAGHATSAF